MPVEAWKMTPGRYETDQVEHRAVRLEQICCKSVTTGL